MNIFIACLVNALFVVVRNRYASEESEHEFALI